MGLHQIVIVEQVEPVGVSHLGFAQICVAGRLGVSQSIFTGHRIVCVDQTIHGTVHTAAAGVGKRCEAEPAFLFHFLVDTHLLLRVAYIEIAVGGFETIGQFTCIVNRGVTGASLLGGHDNHTSHSARAI